MNNASEELSGFPATQEQVRAELEQIRPCLEELTGLVSNWNGSVVLTEDALFKGMKPYGCEIRIGDRFSEPQERWTTLIHEMLHACSVGYNRVNFEQHIGWEEGVVEHLQRSLRGQIFARIGVHVDADLLRQLDTNHPFNRYIAALEQVRVTLESDDLPFYLQLLQTPIKERYGLLMRQALRLPAVERMKAMQALSSANVILQRGRKEGA